jgi:hypothetical protein
MARGDPGHASRIPLVPVSWLRKSALCGDEPGPAPARAVSRTAGSLLRWFRVRTLKIAHIPWNLLARGLVRTGRFGAAGQALARAAMEGIRWPLNGNRTVLLGGLSRVGKSTLAATLATRYGFRHIDLDYLVDRIYAVDDPAGRACCRAAFYHSLLRHVPVGHVIEGDDLVISDRWHRSGQFGQEPLDLTMLGGLAKAFGLPAFVIGVAEATLEERLAVLKRDDGWVTELSEPEMRTYADFLRNGSMGLRDGAERAGVTYLEVDGTDFELAIGSLAHRIEGVTR